MNKAKLEKLAMLLMSPAPNMNKFVNKLPSNLTVTNRNKKIKEYFKSRGIPVNLKYIDPSYMIRSAPPSSTDSIFCAMLGQYAVHAGMAGKTDMIIGLWNNVYTHMPIELVTSERKHIDPDSRFWYSVLDATGQPADMKN